MGSKKSRAEAAANNAVRCAARLGRYDMALSLADKLAEKHPENQRYLRGRGVLLAALGRVDDARRAFARSIKVYPNYRAVEYLAACRNPGSADFFRELAENSDLFSESSRAAAGGEGAAPGAGQKRSKLNILFVNLNDSFENMVFQEAFLKELGGNGVYADVVHGIYSFPLEYKYPVGRLHQCRGLPAARKWLRAGYDAIVFLDIPRAPWCQPLFFWLLEKFNCPRKIIIANHLILSAGDNAIIRKMIARKSLKHADLCVILENDMGRNWEACGAARDAIAERALCVSCELYKPSRIALPKYLVSGGNCSRDCQTLISVARDLKVPLKIITNSKLTITGAPSIKAYRYETITGESRKMIQEAAAFTVSYKGVGVGGWMVSTFLLIALACGKPVIHPNTRFAYKYVREGINGYIYKAGDRRDLAAKLKKVLSLKKDDYLRMSAAARKTALKLASLENFISGFIKSQFQTAEPKL